jgi:hypothetical protein
MRYIKRKTNVRQHNRKTKHKVGIVRNHSRNLKDKQIIGIVALKGLKYKEAKRIFPNLKPYGDIDGDGVTNKRDCRPFDVDKQDDYEDEMERLREEQAELVRRTAEESRQEEIRRQQEEADQNLSDSLARLKQKERRWSVW